MFAPPPTPDAEFSAPPPSRSREDWRLAGDLETALAQTQALEDRVREATAEAQRARAWQEHWWVRLGRGLGFLPAEPRNPREDGGIALDADTLPERLTLMEPSALAALRLQVRRLRAEARVRERRHAREETLWRQKTADLAARAWLESYRQDVRGRLWADWPGWLWWRLERFFRTRRRLLRRRLSRGRLRR